VALGAEQLRLVPSNLAPRVVDKRIPMQRMMAVEAPGVDAVAQIDLRVLNQSPNRLRR
jgi:hypothetical protein